MDTITPKYAFFDADNVGAAIEMLLREDKLDQGINLSNKIKQAFREIEEKFLTSAQIKILISAGDDLLIEITSQSQNHDSFLNETRKLFFEITGLSLSCGVGDTIPEAVQNLYLAKLYGKNRIVGK